MVKWVRPIGVQGSAVGAGLPSGFQYVLRPPAMPVAWPLVAYRGSCWSPSPVSILTAGSQPRSTPVLWVRPHPPKLLIVLVLAPPELWRPVTFHRLFLLGLLLSLFFISLTLGSHPKKFSLLHLLSLRNWKGFFFSPPWIPDALIFAKTQKPRSAMCQQAPGEVVWMNSEMTLNLCSTLRWQVLSFPTTPRHTCFLLDQEIFYCFFSFSLSQPPFFMDTSYLSLFYHFSSGKLIRELKSQERKWPWEGS